jgi:hypothetical protein
MDHRYIEEHSIISRHLTGKLSTRESTEFEEHFLDCPQCLDQLEAEQDFQLALKQAAAEDALVRRNPSPAGLSGWLAGLGPWRQAALWTTAGVLLAMAPTALYIGRTERARREANQGIAASREWQRRYEVERQNEADLEKRLQDSEKKLKQQSGVSGDRSGSSTLPAAASVFLLDTTRSVDAGTPDAANRIEIPAARHWIVLSMERGTEREFDTYRATVTDSEGHVVWSDSGIRPPTPGSLSLALDSGLFHDGDYVLRLEGRTRDGRYTPAARYAFRVRVGR